MAEIVITQVMNGLSTAMIYVLLSISLAIIFGLMKVINMAHGEFYMMGAYTVVATLDVVHNYYVCVLLAFFVVGLIGFLIERTIIKPLYSRPLETLLATAGLSIVLRQVVKLIFGAGFRSVNTPLVGAVSIGPTQYPLFRIFVIVFVVVLLVTMFLLLFKTRWGMQCRAVISNREMAVSLGINTAMCDSVVFAVAAGLAGVSGAVMSVLLTISTEMGVSILAKSFCVVILGGLGNLLGVVGGGLVFGYLEAVISYLSSSIIAQIITLAFCILIIRFRPKGLFGK